MDAVKLLVENTELAGRIQALVGCGDPRIGWPDPEAADPPELRRKLDRSDLKRAVDQEIRRGLARITAGRCLKIAEVYKYTIGQTIEFLGETVDP